VPSLGFLLAVILIALLGCAGSPSPDAFIAELERASFFAHATSHEVRAVKAAIHDRGWPGIFASESRLFPADAEDLAEAGIGSFLDSIAPFLAKQGVVPPPHYDDYTESAYILGLGDQRLEIWRAADWDDPNSINAWQLSSARAVGIVNELLAGAGSQERAYLVNGGNDLQAFFLTPRLFDLITKHPDAEPRDAPYELDPETGARH
jgi:hypothetical protein